MKQPRAVASPRFKEFHITIFSLELVAIEFDISNISGSVLILTIFIKKC